MNAPQRSLERKRRKRLIGVRRADQRSKKLCTGRIREYFAFCRVAGINNFWLFAGRDRNGCFQRNVGR